MKCLPLLLLKSPYAPIEYHGLILVFIDSLQIILHSMHRYKPRFHIIQSDDVYNTRWGLLQVFSFPETEFTAVTAYQNDKVR